MIPLEKWQELINTKCKDWPVKPSPPDNRDWPLQAIAEPVKIPDAASLKHYDTGILDQKQSPLCVAYAMVAILQAHYGLPPGTLSPRFVYWLSHKAAGLPDNVNGTTPRAVLDTVLKYGTCPESMCPSLPDWSKPVFTPEMMAEAAKYKVKAYARLNVGTLDEIEQAIASGRMVLIGSLVTRDDWADGWILDPAGTWLGGHGTCLMEYDRSLIYDGYKRFVGGPNSWGITWGLNGFYQMAEHFAEWRDLDTNMPCLFEAWAVEFDTPFVPRIPAQIKSFDVAPILMPIAGGDRTMVELRGLADVTGATKIDWDNATQMVTLEYPDRVVTLQIGKKGYQVVMK